ncbi:hypothetical protein ONS95_003767 [Cadophora gregata]|uniref:uncharacterized protein n=1 Tax=Cadophora gregata TaxID=51156 RepID=UPI0026DC5AD6|nr:uncharacterized protein ONS95_003767 [Cadophora gregata]KAK0107057.1 hypothetical protein ONS95_003767 [Cadophora gregata]KAK0116745.1 hypothetical protein ONS96_012596 [Cadophora gregata f. sp. sojae]
MASMKVTATDQVFDIYQFHVWPYPPLLNILESEVSFANETLWIGFTKYAQYSEPFCPIVGSQMSFTSWHQAPTGWQNPYIFPDKTTPVYFTTAHGHDVPEGASAIGFGFDKDGRWTFEGQNKFVACQTKEMVKQGPYIGYQIWWKGAGSVRGVNCSEPLSLVKDEKAGSCGSGS